MAVAVDVRMCGKKCGARGRRSVEKGARDVLILSETIARSPDIREPASQALVIRARDLD